MHSTARCGASATAGTVGRRRCPAPMSASWTSASMGSTRSTAITVRTVFRCVASRNRESRPAPGHRASGFGWLYGVGSLGYGWSSTQAAVHASNLGFRYGWLNPQNIDYRATGLQLRCLQEHPKGVLLGFSQPNLNRACQARKFVLGRGAARHSNRAASTPGRGRRCEASRLAQPKARPGFPYDGRRHPQAEGRYFSLRSSDLRWRQPRNCSAAPLPRIMIFDRAPGEILPFQLIVETEYFPFKAWRAGAARHSKAGVGSATSYDCPTRAAAY